MGLHGRVSVQALCGATFAHPCRCQATCLHSVIPLMDISCWMGAMSTTSQVLYHFYCLLYRATHPILLLTIPLPAKSSEVGPTEMNKSINSLQCVLILVIMEIREANRDFVLKKTYIPEIDGSCTVSKEID